MTCVDGQGELLAPCGRCRQVLMEFGGRELLVDMLGGARVLGDLLPDAFTADDLTGRRTP